MATTRDNFLDVYRILAEHLSQGVALIRQGEVLYVNPALSRLTDYSREHSCSLQANGLAGLIHADDLPRVFR